MKSHYFASKQEKYIIVSEGARPVGQKVIVKGKAEARKISAEHGYTPWNF